MTHTPRPWEAREVVDYGGAHLAWDVEGPKRPEGLGGRFGSEADARLIAAAPDTLEQRDELLTVLEGIISHGGPYYEVIPRDLLQRGLAAIARGPQPLDRCRPQPLDRWR